MANPQLENGYTPIANELLEAIYSAKLNGTQSDIILMICRYTYGFSRKSHSLSESFIANAVGSHKSQVKKELKTLISMRIISVLSEPTFSTPREIAINKNYEEWQKSTQEVLSLTGSQSTTSTGSQSTTRGGSQSTTQDKQVLKQNIKQDICAFFPQLWEQYPNKRGKAKVTAKAKKEMDKLGYDKLAACIKRYIEDKPDWQQYQNGSTFFNGGYVDYLDLVHESVENHSPTVGDSEEIKALKAKLRE